MQTVSDIEITNEMIEAGVKAIYAIDQRPEWPYGVLKEVVEAVLRAALKMPPVGAS